MSFVYTTFMQDRGIYGKVEVRGSSVTKDSPFVVHQEDRKGWTMSHRNTGLSVASLIPPGVGRSRAALLHYARALHSERPDDCVMFQSMTLPPSADGPHAEAVRRLFEWARSYGR